MRSRSRPALAALAAVACAWLAGCGARTALIVDLYLGGADASAPAPTPCVPGTIALTKASPVLLFVLDRSGSMAQPLGGASGESKWQTLTDGLASTLPSVDGSMEIGALVFPTTAGGGGRGGFNAASCTVSGGADLAPATGNVPALLALLAGTMPAGSTPTDSAIDAAAGVLLGTRAATTARALVLATDGAPNCNAALDPATCTCAGAGPAGGQGCGGSGAMCLDDVRTVATIASYEAQGLPTYVIGLESTNDAVFSQVLGEMAVAGGRPYGGSTTYYAARSATDLSAALVAIRDQVGACTFLTTSVPNTGGTITLSIDGTRVPYDPTGKSGWAWGDMANGQIVLFGATCTLAAGKVTAAVSADVTCASDGGLESGALPADAAGSD